MPVGNEGAGTVVAAGSSDGGPALVGKVVAGSEGRCTREYRCRARVAQCVELPEGVERGAAGRLRSSTR